MLVETVEIHQDGGCEVVDVRGGELSRDAVSSLTKRIRAICRDHVQLPGFVAAMTALFGPPAAVLGVTAWHRGRMQVESVRAKAPA